MQETLRNLYDGIALDAVFKAAILAARTRIEEHPDYSYATARLLLHTIAREVLGTEMATDQHDQSYRQAFSERLREGVNHGLLDERLLQFDLERRLRCTRSVICSSTTLDCRPCTTVTFCTYRSVASKCRKPSSCEWPWDWH